MKPSPARRAAIRRILSLAARIACDESFIKQSLLEYARAGDCAAVIRFTTLWQTHSSSWVVACIKASRLGDTKPRRRDRRRSR